MKKLLIGTTIGAMALSLRDKFDLIYGAIRAPEKLACISNDVLARKIVERLCRPGHAFVDVGAHIGSVTSGVKRNSNAHPIIAIEPIPQKAEFLKRKFPDIEVHCCAVGKEEAQIPFYIDLSRSAYSSINRNFVTGSSREIMVPLKMLDNIIFHSQVDIIKIDVEGAELAALMGADNLIRNHNPIIMFESPPRESQQHANADIFDWFKDHKYTIFLPDRLAHESPGLTRDGFLEAHHYPRRSTNFFGVPNARIESTRSRVREMLGHPQ